MVTLRGRLEAAGDWTVEDKDAWKLENIVEMEAE